MGVDLIMVLPLRFRPADRNGSIIQPTHDVIYQNSLCEYQKSQCPEISTYCLS